MAHNEIEGHGIGEVRRVREAAVAVGGAVAGSSILTALALSLVLAGGAQAASVPVSASASGSVDTVSPGGIDRMTLVRGTAPSFSWGSVAGAESYELMVYELSDSGRESEAPTLSVRLPGSASSWTPDAREGLEAGREYVWFVRAVTGGRPAALSRGRMFTISGAPSLAEVEAAMNVLRRYSVAGEADGEADEAGALAAAPKASEEFTEPTPAPSLSAPAAVAPEQEPEQEGEANAIAGEIPGPLAPLPFTQLGINSTIAGSDSSGSQVAVRGEWSSTNSLDHVVGYLGITVGDTDLGEFDGLAVLKGLDLDEIGVLGVSANDSSDNYGVVGVGRGSATAGRFFNAGSNGEVSNQVFLGTNAAAINAQGPIRWHCPLNMDRAGTWCIDKVVNPAEKCGASVITCHNEGKALCPLEAIMTCDLLNIRNSTLGSCGDRTDDPATTVTRTFGLDTDPISFSAFGQFINWHGDNTTSKSFCTTTHPYFCCKPVSP